MTEDTIRIELDHGGKHEPTPWRALDKMMLDIYRPALQETAEALIDFNDHMALTEIESDPLRRRSLKKLRGVHRKQEAAIRHLLSIIRYRSQRAER